MLNTLATYNYLYWMTTGGNDTACYFYIQGELQMDLERQKHAPICDALERFKKKRVVPFDVPGHKREEAIRNYVIYLENNV